MKLEGITPTDQHVMPIVPPHDLDQSHSRDHFLHGFAILVQGDGTLLVVNPERRLDTGSPDTMLQMRYISLEKLFVRI